MPFDVVPSIFGPEWANIRTAIHNRNEIKIGRLRSVMMSGASGSFKLAAVSPWRVASLNLVFILERAVGSYRVFVIAFVQLPS